MTTDSTTGSSGSDTETAPATFSAQTDDGSSILRVAGEIDVATSPQFREALHGLIDDGAESVVVDLSGTTFMDSSGLGVLVGALKRLRSDRQADVLELRGLQPPVYRVFEITGLAEIFTISD